MDNVHYVGFWARLVAAIVDSIVLSIALVPLLAVLQLDAHIEIIGGLPVVDADFWKSATSQALLAAALVIAFWGWKMATPGKMIIGAVIVDEKTFGKPNTWQLILRYFGYYVSTLFFMLGFLWVALDARKQGWHDKIAGTVVIRKPH